MLMLSLARLCARARLDAALQRGALGADQVGGVVLGDAVAHGRADLRAQADVDVRRTDVLVEAGRLGPHHLVDDGDVDADVEALGRAGVDLVARRGGQRDLLLPHVVQRHLLDHRQHDVEALAELVLLHAAEDAEEDADEAGRDDDDGGREEGEQAAPAMTPPMPAARMGARWSCTPCTRSAKPRMARARPITSKMDIR
jgi:hypothetical protein